LGPEKASELVNQYSSGTPVKVLAEQFGLKIIQHGLVILIEKVA